MGFTVTEFKEEINVAYGSVLHMVMRSVRELRRQTKTFMEQA